MWLLQAYQKIGDALVSETPLPDDFGRALRPLLDVAADDPLYDSYSVTPAVAALVERVAHIAPELDRFDYFVEFEADSSPPGAQADPSA